jgi:hypothetical protein
MYSATRKQKFRNLSNSLHFTSHIFYTYLGMFYVHLSKCKTCQGKSIKYTMENTNGLFTLATFIGDNASDSAKCLYLPWPPWAI